MAVEQSCFEKAGYSCPSKAYKWTRQWCRKVLWVMWYNVALIECKLKVFQRDIGKQHKHVFHTSPFPLWTSTWTKQRQIITHNTRRHCRVIFYAFVREKFTAKQLYIMRKFVMRSLGSEGNSNSWVNNFWEENGAGLVTPCGERQTTSLGKLWGGIPKGRERGGAPGTAGDGTLRLNWSWTKSPNSSSLARTVVDGLCSTWSDGPE